MNNVHLLEIRKVEILARGIRGNLVGLRRLKMIRGTAPGSLRDPALDKFLGSMIELRARLLHDIAALGPDCSAAYQGRPITEIAGQVLADTGEMVELLIWLGARGSESELKHNSRHSLTTGD